MPDENTISITMVPSDFAEPIGRMIVACVHVESAFEVSLIRLMRVTEEVGLAVLSQLAGFQPRLKLFDRLCAIRFHDPAETERLRKLRAALNSAYDFRNLVAHDSPGGWSPSRRKLFYSRGRYSLVLQSPADELKNLRAKPIQDIGIDEINAAFVAFERILVRLHQFNAEDARWKDGEPFP
jgi:hypothetical protein